MKKPVLVIMAAGMGSRYGGLKQIDPIDDQGHIIMDFSIFDAKRAGFEKVVFIIKRENEADFREAIGNRIEKVIDVAYAYQDLYNIPEGFEVPEFTPEWHWGETTIYGTEDPDYFFAENSGWGMQLAGDGQLHRYENYYFHTFRFNNEGKIDYYREITNPLNLMTAMGCRYEPMPRPEDTIAQLIELYEQDK